MKYNISDFGKKIARYSGILELMDDLGQAMNTDDPVYMLGGGNPAHIPEINKLWRRRMHEILENGNEFERMLANYDTPQGKGVFLEAMATMLSNQYGWNIEPENIAVTNGSQSAFFFLLNMFAGYSATGKKKILFPLIPEYIGYADQVIEEDVYCTNRPVIKELPGQRFKYHVNFETLSVTDEIGAICVSRPTNPTGNVLTDEEIDRLSLIAMGRGIPLIVDNAYGVPFPQILFTEANLSWNENIILGMSLSKIGLPSARTGIIVASEEIIAALSAANAIASLSIGSVGQVLTAPLISSGELIRLSQEVITPFYKERSLFAQKKIDETMAELPYRIHVSEGALFLWLWFKDLPITTSELYQRLKQRHTLVVPGKYFFFGSAAESDISWRHQHECIRINYGRDAEEVSRGIEIISDEARKAYGG